MKQNKWQRLAAIGLCGSLLVNAFSGVTAVAETVTIESSPTAESSVKEETQASSETQETTTETSREVAEKTEQPVEVQNQETVDTSQDAFAENNQSKGVPPSETTPISSEANPSQIKPRWVPLKTVVYPNVQYDFVDETGTPFTEQLVFSGNYQAFKGGDFNSTPVPLPAPYNKLSAQNNGSGSYILSVSNGSAMPFTEQTIANYGGGGTNPVVKYRTMFILDKLNIATPLKFVDSIEYDFVNSNWALYLYTGFNATTGIFDNSVEEAKTFPMSETSKDAKFQKNAQGYFEIIQPSTFAISSGDFTGWTIPGYSNIRLFGFDGTNTIKSKMIYKVTRKQVTEKFVDGTGVAITPPTGFTQNKKTPMTSNNFTYTSAKALPDTYKAGGKTYKFKGWYKGKTKPATLETSKTPSYAVTYDDNDDLTVVYEDQTSITLPGASYQFGFIDDSGKIVDPSKVGLTYDLWLLDKKVSTVTNKNLSGVNIGNVKSMSIPDKEIPLPVYGDGNSLFSPINMTFSLPKYYSNMTINTGLNSSYPLPVVTEHRSNEAPKEVPTTDASFALQKVADQSYTTAYTNSNPVAPNVKFPILYRRYAVPPMGLDPYTNYSTFSGPVYYTLTQRRVTEHFVDNNGNEIPAPTGFTQGKQTVIDSENFTYTSANALPDTYTAGDKSYKFKGWYKGIDKTALETTKTPSYAVTYDNKDDMTAVYEEVQETTVHPGFYAEFVDEQGKAFTNPLTLSGNYTEFLRKNATSPFEATGSLYPMAGSKEATVANRYKIETKQNVLIPNNYELLPDPATGVLNRGFALNNFGITNELKYVDKVEATTKTITLYDYDTISDIGTNLLSDAATTSLNSFETTLNKETNNTFSVKAKWGQSGLSRDILPNLLFLTSANSKPRLFGFDGTSDYKQTINYKITRKQVTENFVDATGAKITPPTGFTQGKQIPMTSNSFTYTSANALPDTYTAGDKSYKFKGWYKGIDKTALETTKTPSYAVTYDDKDDMTAVYEEVQPTAEMTVSRLLEVIPNGSSMVWTVRLKNTSEVPLTNIKLAPTAKWAAGISAPTQLAVRIGSTSKIIPVTAEQWRTGVNLGVEIPVNGEALVTVNTAKITGEPRQLLTAEMTASGNFSAVTASNFVRIQGEDQTITPAPVEEGFISTPTFDFGKITISSSAKQYGLKKAADYYGNGTRNPYLRIKKSQPNWQLTAQLSQLKASTDSLPTSTRLLLGNADVAAIENYNQVTESTNKVGVTKALTLTSDGTSTPVILNNQFTGNDVYQLDFDFASVKLDVPANQGKINEKYQGTVTWNLVTGP
ncbi:WxL domain-containing protein [Enterococcus faecalis]|uniref:WxL domain-containing protein n=1 Tax=Enterococcus faecalis TaxID=1351 RepID=UPI0023A927B7|nr:WxL domain-containing protein [Enterococcus faecalis]WEB06538.1 WxL domain-containing protein [Enterococcus faecalis]